MRRLLWWSRWFGLGELLWEVGVELHVDEEVVRSKELL